MHFSGTHIFSLSCLYFHGKINNEYSPHSVLTLGNREIFVKSIALHCRHVKDEGGEIYEFSVTILESLQER